MFKLSVPVALSRIRCSTVRAQWMKSLRKQRLPCFEMPISLALPPVVISRGTRPSHAARSRPLPKPLPATILAGSKSDRNGLLQTESKSSTDRCKDVRSNVRCIGRSLRPIHPKRMLELLLRGRVWIRLTARSFNAHQMLLSPPMPATITAVWWEGSLSH